MRDFFLFVICVSWFGANLLTRRTWFVKVSDPSTCDGRWSWHCVCMLIPSGLSHTEITRVLQPCCYLATTWLKTGSCTVATVLKTPWNCNTICLVWGLLPSCSTPETTLYFEGINHPCYNHDCRQLPCSHYCALHYVNYILYDTYIKYIFVQ